LERKNPSREQKHKTRPLINSERTDLAGNAVENLILQSIPEQEFSLLRPYLEPAELPTRLTLHEPGEKIEFAYFLNQGLCSLVVLTSDGRSVEVAIVGKEGILGMPLVAGLRHSPWRAIMQIPGQGLRIASMTLGEFLAQTPELQALLNRYVLVRGLQVAQIAACNRLHEIEQRLARWLLMCQDSIESDLVPVTHDFLAQMLGTGRPSVSLAAGLMQRAGMIENLRGAVRIINRKKLEQAVCECYRAIHQFNSALDLP